ncbi:hypothetical protein LCM10_19795 [Rossellomorea aquimaris]|uniref:CotY/CotZ family spore coat protein n=1 Tax=Rossellomorea aquimaris TaxID=189382 RepID=UPI001CD4A7EF|nr:CotY/CotZ family spore coat protein [Rossellomorea aquimaris]MCA1057192.1 hypothetical protein [Rossellomorea aquimaris]
MKSCHDEHCICKVLTELFLEQSKLAAQTFKFICEHDRIDTIPFILYTKEKSEPFKAHLKSGCTIFFMVSDINDGCVTLRLLAGVDIDGYITDDTEDVFALYKTDQCITVDCNCFLGIQPLPPKLVNRKLPTIHGGDGKECISNRYKAE